MPAIARKWRGSGLDGPGPRVTPRRILVTGASGFVGGHLVPALAAAFPDAMLTATATDPGPGQVTLDVTDAGAVAALVGMLRPDACVHLAAIAAIPAARRDPDLAWRVNLGGTLNLARAILAGAPKCRLLFVSSADIYGASFRSGQALDEGAVVAPLNTYGATKAAADLALGAMANDGLLALRARPFNHTGAGQSDSFVVAAFARQVARIEAGLQPPVAQVGALHPWRDFLDVRDVCAAYVACLQPDATWPADGILNIASGLPRRVGDVLGDLIAAAGIDARIETAPGLLRAGDIATATGDAGRARAMLGWAPQVAWERTIAAVLDDWRARVRA